MLSPRAVATSPTVRASGTSCCPRPLPLSASCSHLAVAAPDPRSERALSSAVSWEGCSQSLGVGMGSSDLKWRREVEFLFQALAMC